MKDKLSIFINLIQKIAIYKSGQNTGVPIRCHIVMLDWVLSNFESARDIGVIIEDKEYTLSPKDYILKSN